MSNLDKNIDEVKLEEFRKRLEPLKKSLWYPKTKQIVSERISSKFSGVPVLLNSEEWPCCQHCNKPMQLFLQVNLNELPDEVRSITGEGYLQVFYCTNTEDDCEIECEAFAPFSKSTLVRILDSNLSLDVSKIQSPVDNAFPERTILKWEGYEDYPNWEELTELGFTFKEVMSDVFDNLWLWTWGGDKLLWRPAWIQGVCYPKCPKCGEKMRGIFQINSEENIPYMFGDAGYAYITQCKEHKDQLAMIWFSC